MLFVGGGAYGFVGVTVLAFFASVLKKKYRYFGVGHALR